MTIRLTETTGPEEINNADARGDDRRGDARTDDARGHDVHDAGQ